ncbi:hypothetical protein [uncultured Leifsonia sp.]|uniref:hypothetical protein n=1 Tax=uncultured Leifsonia sp. TaxID=340359 RepID=UPI0028D8F45B|nr:hypothetical protein [uncultured Leifsonia sp.]
MTAEFAAALPAVLLCLALCLAAVQAGAQQAQLTGTAAQAARLLARGEDGAGGQEGASADVERADGMVCVRLTAPSAVTGLAPLGVRVSARACALDEAIDGEAER